MAKKILLFVSGNIGQEAEEYICPDGTVVQGGLTNEAPVKYLLKTYPNVQELICVVTPEAKNAYQELKKRLNMVATGLSYVEVPFQESMSIEQCLPGIMENIKQNDEILLETTGGFRNAVMYMMLLSRLLLYVDSPIVQAVYSRRPAPGKQGSIEDVSKIIRLFDLINGMQELSSFGSVRTLRQYYGQAPEDARIASFLESMEQLNESILLCRVKQISENLKNFQTSLIELKNCSDPIMQALLPAFRKKFNGKLKTIDLIRWYLESDMLPQALTLYTEKIPERILGKNRPLETREGQSPWRVKPEHAYRDEATDELLENVFMLSWKSQKINPYQTEKSHGKYKQDWYPWTLKHLKKLLPNEQYDVNCSMEKLHQILCDYLYIKALRNLTNHASETVDSFKKEQEEYLCEQGYPALNDVTLPQVKKIMFKALARLSTIR
ncbi:hypothetical protein B5E65_05450 [Gemmiger sp. An120]|uniref:TM1812 family CRISPR-associated protein n=1 Tax=Gemmiger sp. An120 TaxID=1965549 RepID=UPI000B372191|nr:TM1812 family CRISPR-associated protein [Gemmiger sp. An120]OUQ43220.1 hypothetical protein B5E65_05450 [Gemmiger sp. An120]